MFAVGQRVWHRDGRRSGTVLECDGDRIFIEQDNGAELDLRLSDVTATPPATAKPGETRQQGSGPAGLANYVMPDRILTPADVTPEHAKVLAAIPVRTLQAIAALHERKPGAGKFSALDVAAKLNRIAEITAVPYRTMRQYRDSPGELSLLMGKGLADSQKAGR